MKSNIRKLREARGLTQAELGRRIGSTASTISRLEESKRKLTMDYLVKLADVLACEPSDLMAASLPALDRSSLISVVGIIGSNTWSVPESSAGSEVIPVVPFGRFAKFAFSAWKVVDDHAGPQHPAGSFAIAVPFSAARKSPVDGDVCIVRSTEGRMQRFALGVIQVHGLEVFFELDGTKVLIGSDHVIQGFIVGSFWAS